MQNMGAGGKSILAVFVGLQCRLAEAGWSEELDRRIMRAVLVGKLMKVWGYL